MRNSVFRHFSGGEEQGLADAHAAARMVARIIKQGDERLSEGYAKQAQNRALPSPKRRLITTFYAPPILDAAGRKRTGRSARHPDGRRRASPLRVESQVSRRDGWHRRCRQ